MKSILGILCLLLVAFVGTAEKSYASPTYIAYETCAYDRDWIFGAPNPTVSCEMYWEPQATQAMGGRYGKHTGEAYYTPNPAIMHSWNTGSFALTDDPPFSIFLVVCSTVTGLVQIIGHGMTERAVYDRLTGAFRGFVLVVQDDSGANGYITANAISC